jgi:hypothetical protein
MHFHTVVCVFVGSSMKALLLHIDRNVENHVFVLRLSAARLVVPFCEFLEHLIRLPLEQMIAKSPTIQHS